MPVWGQHAAVSAFGLYRYWLRFGPGYADFVKEYKERELYTPEMLRAWQRKRVMDLLKIAAQNVPYYRNCWTNKEKASALAGRLEDLPLLGKDPLRTDPWSFIRDDIQMPRPHVFHTSGSTGTPIASIWSTIEVRNSRALREVRSAGWAGVSFGMPRATFSGRIVEPNPDSSGPFYRFNVVERQAYLSAFHLRPDTARFYVKALARHRIQWLTGYAVSYYLLAKYIIDQGLKVAGLRALVTTSEKVMPEMRECMEKAYGCKVYEEYSTVENAVFASDCEQGKLHVSMDACVLEILRSDGSPCDPGETGEVVSTCLIRDYQPLIRFRVGDLAAWDPVPCSCGRRTPVLKEVVGRIEDVVVGPDGRQMVRFHGIFVNQPHILEGQIIQEEIKRIRVKIVPCKGFCDLDVKDVQQRVWQRLGPQVQVIVELTDTIPRTKAGKYKAVVSLIGKPIPVGK